MLKGYVYTHCPSLEIHTNARAMAMHPMLDVFNWYVVCVHTVHIHLRYNSVT